MVSGFLGGGFSRFRVLFLSGGPFLWCFLFRLPPPFLPLPAFSNTHTHTFLRLKLLLLFAPRPASFRRCHPGVYVILLYQMLYCHFSSLLALSSLFSARFSLSPSLALLGCPRRCLCRRRCPVCFFFLFLIEICGLHQYLLFPCVFHVIKNLVQVFRSFFPPILCCVVFVSGTILYCRMGRIWPGPFRPPPTFPDFPVLWLWRGAH